MGSERWLTEALNQTLKLGAAKGAARPPIRLWGIRAEAPTEMQLLQDWTTHMLVVCERHSSQRTVNSCGMEGLPSGRLTGTQETSKSRHKEGLLA